jgi:integrase/recombinase XerD
MAKISLKHVNSFYDRHGRLRHVCRIPGRKSFTLPGLPGSAEFMEAYQAALGGDESKKKAAFGGAPVPPTEIGASRTKAGTVDAAIVAYYNSKMFEARAPDTQRKWRQILERFRKSHGEKRIALLQRQHVAKLLEPLTHRAQKSWLTAIRGLMAYALAEDPPLITSDPSEGIKPMKAAKSMGHMTWLAPQIAVYRERYKLGTTARLAVELMLNIGARRYDAHLFGDQHYPRRAYLLAPAQDAAHHRQAAQGEDPARVSGRA